MALQGYIKVYREVQTHWIYDEKRTFSKYEAWLDLLMMANHKDNKVMMDGELVEVKRGQRITSERKLSEKWGWSRTKTRNFLELLEKDSMIFYEKRTGKNTMIEIAKYDMYQGSTDLKENKSTSKKTSDVPVKDQSKTSDVPVKDLNNNDKNVKHEKNEYKNIIIEVVNHLNEKAGKSFNPDSKATVKDIKARINEKFTLEDFKLVIDYCVEEWTGKIFSNGVKGETYLRPSSLFNGKFDEKLNAAKSKVKTNIGSHTNGNKLPEKIEDVFDIYKNND